MSVVTGQMLSPEAVPAGAAAAPWPRISLATPARDSVDYIEQTIRSVLVQGYPNLEYFIIDGGSTDGTLEIIQKYEKDISGWISEPDTGMYDALNKGFARTSGEIMGWISATDQLQIGALFAVASVFRDLPNVEWITGRPTYFNERGVTIRVEPLRRWSHYRFLAGANRHIQQESTFWRRSLWEKAGARMDASGRIAGDFELWVRFFRHSRLYPVDALIGGFRFHSDSTILGDMKSYDQRCDDIIEHALNSTLGGKSVRLFRQISNRFQSIPKVRWLWRHIVINGLYKLSGPDWAPVIEYRENKWVFRR